MNTTSQKLQARARQQDTQALGDVVPIDQAAVLRTLGFDPRDPNTQAALLICGRYGLDPVMKHIVPIKGRPYITRDGYLAIAHRSGQFDGMEVVEQGETDTHWTAKVAVYRKDMGRPFAYVGRYPKSGTQKQYGPEMAVKTAEVHALRRAFEVVGVGAADEQWDDTPVAAVAHVIDGTIGESGAHDLNAWLRRELDTDDLRDRMRIWWVDNDLPLRDDGAPDFAALTDDQVEIVKAAVAGWVQAAVAAEAEAVEADVVAAEASEIPEGDA